MTGLLIHRMLLRVSRKTGYFHCWLIYGGMTVSWEIIFPLHKNHQEPRYTSFCDAEEPFGIMVSIVALCSSNLARGKVYGKKESRCVYLTSSFLSP